MIFLRGKNLAQHEQDKSRLAGPGAAATRWCMYTFVACGEMRTLVYVCVWPTSSSAHLRYSHVMSCGDAHKRGNGSCDDVDCCSFFGLVFLVRLVVVFLFFCPFCVRSRFLFFVTEDGVFAPCTIDQSNHNDRIIPSSFFFVFLGLFLASFFV